MRSRAVSRLLVHSTKGNGLNPKKGQDLGPEGRAPTQGPSKEKTFGGKEVVFLPGVPALVSA